MVLTTRKIGRNIDKNSPAKPLHCSMLCAWVYILTNGRHTTLYVGSTSAISTRLWEHRTKQNPKSFTARYNVSIPVYYEAFDTVEKAMTREKFIKGKSRKWKESLVSTINPEWKDLTEDISKLSE